MRELVAFTWRPSAVLEASQDLVVKTLILFHVMQES